MSWSESCKDCPLMMTTILNIPKSCIRGLSPSFPACVLPSLLYLWEYTTREVPRPAIWSIWSRFWSSTFSSMLAFVPWWAGVKYPRPHYTWPCCLWPSMVWLNTSRSTLISIPCSDSSCGTIKNSILFLLNLRIFPGRFAIPMHLSLIRLAFLMLGEWTWGWFR